MLQSENRRRDAEKRDDSYDDVYLTQELSDGTKAEKRVDRVSHNIALHEDLHLTKGIFQAFLDLTDQQNRDFRYVL